jgi:hypothetical protein
MGLDEFVNEFILGRMTDSSGGGRAEYTANNGPKVYCVDLRAAITAEECRRALTK